MVAGAEDKVKLSGIGRGGAGTSKCGGRGHITDNQTSVLPKGNLGSSTRKKDATLKERWIGEKNNISRGWISQL